MTLKEIFLCYHYQGIKVGLCGEHRSHKILKYEKQ